MAGKNQVTLTFAGDSAKLESAFDRVGESSRNMTEEVGKAGEGFERVGESADVGEQRILGAKDAVDGVATIMKGPGEQGIAAYLQGWADLSSGVANFAIPALRKGVAAMKATRLASLSMLGPISLIVAAVALLAVVVVKNWDKIKSATVTAFNAVRGAISNAFNWVRRNWPLLLGILTGPIGLAVVAIAKNWDKIVSAVRGMPGRIRRAASGMWNGIKDAFRGAINSIIGAWNSLQFTLPSVKVFGKTVGGFTIGTPDIPYMHSGGTVPGPPGSETLAVLQAGERVTPAGRDASVVLELRSSGTGLDDLLVQIIARAVRDRGGNVQVVLGAA